MSRSTGDGIITITERGDPICAVVEVLKDSIGKEPGNAILEKWVDDLIAAAKMAQGVAKEVVRIKFL